MVTISLEEQNFKDLLKQALVELFEERQDLFHELVIEALEDAGLSQAIKEGEASEDVGEDEVIQVLKGAA